MAIKLSIATAVYNLDAPFLRSHIEGIIGQLTDETELLLIDDCSTNGSGDICREYVGRDCRVRYINMGQNGGLSRVRNRSIDESQGKWLFFADGDDLLSDNFIETALRFCDSDDDIIILDRLKFVQEKGEEQPCSITELNELPSEAGRVLSISCLCLDTTMSAQFGLSSRAFYHAAWGALYRRDFLLKNKLRFPDGQKKAQDSVFNTEAYFCAEKIAYLPYVMYFYRSNEQGITRRYSQDLSEVLGSLLGHLNRQMEQLYPNDKDVEARYKNHRVLSVVMDNMRLNVFHRDNPEPKEKRKQAFLQFIQQEPYKSAIDEYNPKSSGRWEWHLPIKLMQKKRFALLDLFMGKPKAFQFLCAADKRIVKLFK